MTEKVIDVFVDRPDSEYNEEIEDNMMIEEDEHFCEKYGCRIASVLVRATGWVTLQAWVFNIFSDPVMLQSDEVMGTLSPVEVERVVKKVEHVGEGKNQSCIQRVVIGNRLQLLQYQTS